MSLVFRAACDGDLDRLLDVHVSSFPDLRGIDARRRNFAANPLGSLSDLVVAEESGVVVAHAFLFALKAWFGGATVAVGGVASVGVAPESRRRGTGRALLAEIHARAFARGDAVTVLYPFRQGYYARDGYMSASPYRKLRVCPRSIPKAWAHDGRTKRSVRAATSADREGLARLHEAHGKSCTGWISRPSALWDRRLSNERCHWFVLDDGGHAAGYVAYTLEQTEPHAPTALWIDELVAEDDAGRMRLLGLIGAQGDQVAEVHLYVPDDDPIERALVDLDRNRFAESGVEHALGIIAGGPMVRVVDARRALVARGYLTEGQLDISVEDDEPLHVEVRTGAAAVTPSRGGPRLCVTRAAFGAVLYGGLSVRAAARLGLASADDLSTIRLADSLLALPPFFSVDPF